MAAEEGFDGVEGLFDVAFGGFLLTEDGGGDFCVGEFSVVVDLLIDELLVGDVDDAACGWSDFGGAHADGDDFV